MKKVLQKLANAENDDEDDGQSHDIVVPSNSTSENHHNDEFNRQEAQLLKQEAELPIEELLKRYNDQEERADPSAKVDESGEAEKKAISATDPEQHESKETTTASDSQPDSTVCTDVYLSRLLSSLIVLFRKRNHRHLMLNQDHVVLGNQSQQMPHCRHPQRSRRIR